MHMSELILSTTVMNCKSDIVVLHAFTIDASLGVWKKLSSWSLRRPWF